MFLTREYHLHLEGTRFYSVLIGMSAFFLMLSALVPFEVVLIPAVAATPRRWRRVWLAGFIGSALGATALAALFQYFGWPLIDRLIPSLATSAGWLVAQRWMVNYGVLALVAIATLPIAQAPVLVLCGLLKTPLVYVVLAFLAGKAMKYAVISLLVVRSETRLRRMLDE